MASADDGYIDVVGGGSVDNELRPDVPGVGAVGRTGGRTGIAGLLSYPGAEVDSEAMRERELERLLQLAINARSAHPAAITPPPPTATTPTHIRTRTRATLVL